MCVLCCSKHSGIVAACECLVKRSDGSCVSALHCEDIVLVLIEQTRCRLFIMRDQVAVCTRNIHADPNLHICQKAVLKLRKLYK